MVSLLIMFLDENVKKFFRERQISEDSSVSASDAITASSPSMQVSSPNVVWQVSSPDPGQGDTLATQVHDISLNPSASPYVPSANVNIRPIDAWIDDLVPGVETTIQFSASNDLQTTFARLELDRDLPKVDLLTFDGSPLMWPRFVEQFFIHVHSRPGLNDCRKLEILQSHVKGEAKKQDEDRGGR